MSHDSFHERLARIQAEQVAHSPPPEAQAEHPLDRKLTLGTILFGRQMREALLVPLALILGGLVMLGAELISFHYMPGEGSFATSVLGMLSGFLGDIGLNIAGALIVSTILYNAGQHVATIAFAVGNYLMMFHGDVPMKAYPDLWATLFSPEYVAISLYFMAEHPELF